MESLDFVRDLTDKFKSQKIQYLIFTVRKDKKKNRKVDIFSSLETEQDMMSIAEVFGENIELKDGKKKGKK